MLAETPSPHGAGYGYCVRGRLTARYLAAVPRRILSMEQQVWSIQLAKQSTLRPRVAAPIEQMASFEGQVEAEQAMSAQCPPALKAPLLAAGFFTAPALAPNASSSTASTPS